jgi:hypothetical protein
MNTLAALSAFALSLSALGAVGCSAAAGDPTDATTGSDQALDQSDPAAATGKGQGQPAQMNDLSVLFPLATTSAQVTSGYLAASSAGKGGELLPETMLEKATGITAKPTPVMGEPRLSYDTLRAVAFRVDPCFANIGPVTDGAACDNQLRIVFQSATYAKGATTLMDGAVHAFYSLSRAELTEVVQAIIALRIASGGAGDLGPLAVHPILAKQGLEGKMAKGLEALLLAHAGAANLTRFTVFQGVNLDTDWDFSAFDVKKGVATPSAVPGLATASTSVIFGAGFAATLAGVFVPVPSDRDDLSLLTNVASATAATPAARQSAFDAALRVENPNFESPNTSDCASCHMAEPARTLVGTPVFKLSPVGNVNAFAADPSIPAKDLARTTDPTAEPDGLNLHAFSYKDGTPMINQRVVNETAANLVYVNAEVLGLPR